MKCMLPATLILLTLTAAVGMVQAQDQGISDLSPQQRKALMNDIEARKQAEKARKAERKQEKQAREAARRERVREKLQQAEQRMGESD